MGRGSHLLGHLQQRLVVTFPFGPPLRRFLLQLLDLLGHLGGKARRLAAKGGRRGTEALVSHLLHLLSEGGEDLVAFGQGALKLLELVHVQGELWRGRGGRGEERSAPHLPAGPTRRFLRTAGAHLLLELRLLLLHHLTLAPGLRGVLQQLERHMTLVSPALRSTAKHHALISDVLTKSRSLCCFSSTSRIISVILCSLASISCCWSSLCLNTLSMCCKTGKGGHISRHVRLDEAATWMTFSKT